MADNHEGFEAFKDVQCALVVVAHADDLETMIGGTVWLLAQRGVQIYELICTRGDLGSNDEHYTRDRLAAVRLEEARRGAEMLGVREVVTLPHPDGELLPSLELRAEIALHYRLWQPDTLFTFDPSWAGQIHPDHIAAGRAAVDAVMPSKMRLYKPEQLRNAAVGKVERAFLFSPAQPSIFVDVGEVYEKKLAAALAHHSQFPEGDKNLDWMRQLDEAAARRADTGATYMEQFASLRLW